MNTLLTLALICLGANAATIPEAGGKPVSVSGVAAGSDLSACRYGDIFDPDPRVTLYRPSGSPWKLYTQHGDINESPNHTDVCLYNEYVIWMQGLVADGDITVEGDDRKYLRIQTALVQGDSTGRRFIRPDVLLAGPLKVVGNKLTYGANSAQSSFIEDLGSQVSQEYFINLGGLKAMMRTWGSARSTAMKVAWVSRNRVLERDPNKNRSFTVYWRPNENAMVAISKAFEHVNFVGEPGPKNYCVVAPGKMRPKMALYLAKVLKTPGANKWTGYGSGYGSGSPKLDDPNLQPPHIAFTCLDPGVGNGGNFQVAVPSWTAGTKTLSVVTDASGPHLEQP